MARSNNSDAKIPWGVASSPPVHCVLSDRVGGVDPPRRPVSRPTQVGAVVLSLDATVLPLATTTLEVAEQVRTRLMGAHKRLMGGDESKVSPLFSGKRENGEKRLDHGHVYIWPLGNEVGRIDRIVIANLHGAFRQDELDAVRGVRELYQRDGRPAVRCVLTWQGRMGTGGEWRRARAVRSATPFVPPRHWRKGRDFARFMEDEVRRECRNHGIESRVVAVAPCALESLFDVVEYRRNRKEDPVRPGYSVMIEFDHEVTTPFAIGYGAHFGLGRFRPVE